MDAPYYNGDDTREFGPEPGAERCVECGVGPLEDCAWWCECPSCVTGRDPVQAQRGEHAA